MIPKDCKRLAEVDFPIAEVSRHAAREMLPQVQGSPGAGDEALRKALLKFIADFANWDLAANRSYLEVSRALVKAAHGEEPPLVVDPFAGGGSIPLEALRLGCEAFASDLNPVACLILKVMLEDIPRHGPKLAEELRRVGAEIKRQMEKALADLYPKDADGATPIAYLWARTVRCESPNCGAERRQPASPAARYSRPGGCEHNSQRSAVGLTSSSTHRAVGRAGRRCARW